MDAFMEPARNFDYEIPSFTSREIELHPLLVSPAELLALFLGLW